MTGWATCLNCGEPVPGVARLEARLCGPDCLDEGLRELDQLDAQLDLTRWTDEDGRLADAMEGVMHLHRRSLLLHAVAAWEQTARTPAAPTS